MVRQKRSIQMLSLQRPLPSMLICMLCFVSRFSHALVGILASLVGVDYLGCAIYLVRNRVAVYEDSIRRHHEMLEMAAYKDSIAKQIRFEAKRIKEKLNE